MFYRGILKIVIKPVIDAYVMLFSELFLIYIAFIKFLNFLNLLEWKIEVSF